MIINGNETMRDDGTERVIGYGTDKDGNITGCFALPDGSDWDCPDATNSITIVNSMDDLPSVDSKYLGS